MWEAKAWRGHGKDLSSQGSLGSVAGLWQRGRMEKRRWDRMGQERGAGTELKKDQEPSEMLGDAWPPDKVTWDWELLGTPIPEPPWSCIPRPLNQVLPLSPRAALD